MKLPILMLVFFSFYAFSAVTPDECIKLNNGIGSAMYISMLDDLKLARENINEGKTETKIVSITPVTYPLAIVYGKEEKRLSGEHSEDRTTAEEYAKGFMADHARNIIAEYTFENKEGKKNIFLASAFASDTDCSVRFNGYIIVKRDF
ncbi:hypothetical protein CYR55_11720 [Chimaeribacter californicus]|uniref:Shiga toxin A subunit n=1 Tax=Chimaeribacter californicus TaxID=2060067 RepID=A0A2N5E6C8_9GAMM|nr:hypothetical protein [Chimaeribacter californicus]PLR36857.1 hypothetical protein CYR55_11720 [Chimaeribacter californicus]